MKNSTSNDIAEQYRRNSNMFKNPNSTFGQKEKSVKKKKYPPTPKLNKNKSQNKLIKKEEKNPRESAKKTRSSARIKSLDKPKFGGIYGMERKPIEYNMRHDKISINSRKIKPYFDPENMWTNIQSKKRTQSRDLKKLARDVKHNRINVASRDFQDKMSKLSEKDNDIRNDPLFIELEKLMHGNDNKSRDNFSVKEMKKHKSVGRIETMSHRAHPTGKRSRYKKNIIIKKI